MCELCENPFADAMPAEPQRAPRKKKGRRGSFDPVPRPVPCSLIPFADGGLDDCLFPAYHPGDHLVVLPPRKKKGKVSRQLSITRRPSDKVKTVTAVARTEPADSSGARTLPVCQDSTMANEHGSVPLVEEVLEAEVVGAEVVVVENESQVKLNRLIVLAEQSLLNDRKVEELSAEVEKMRAKVAEQAQELENARAEAAQHLQALRKRITEAAEAAASEGKAMAMAHEETEAARTEACAAVAAEQATRKRLRGSEAEAEQLRIAVSEKNKKLKETQKSLDARDADNKRLADSLQLAHTQKQQAEQCARLNALALQTSAQYAAAHFPIGQSPIGFNPVFIPAKAP